MGGPAGHSEAQCEHSLGGHADVHVGRFTGDREGTVAAIAGQLIAATVDILLGFFVGDDAENHPDSLRDFVRSRHGQHHRRQGGLHVIGAAPDQVVAFFARLKLMGLGRDHVHVAVEDDRWYRGVPHFGFQHRKTAALGLDRVDAASFEPALDETRRLVDPVGPRGVVGDQAPREGGEIRDSQASRLIARKASARSRSRFAS